MNFPSAAIALFFVCASFLLLFFLISFVSVKLPIWGSVFQTARGQHVRAGPPFHPTVCPSGWQWHKCLIVITASVRVCLSGGGEIHALGNVRRLAVTLTPTQTPITHTHTHICRHTCINADGCTLLPIILSHKSLPVSRWDKATDHVFVFFCFWLTLLEKFRTL